MTFNGVIITRNYLVTWLRNKGYNSFFYILVSFNL